MVKCSIRAECDENFLHLITCASTVKDCTPEAFAHSESVASMWAIRLFGAWQDNKPGHWQAFQMLQSFCHGNPGWANYALLFLHSFILEKFLQFLPQEKALQQDFESFQVLDQRTITSRNYAVSLIFKDSEKSKLHMQNLNLKKLWFGCSSCSAFCLTRNNVMNTPYILGSV